MNPNSTNPTPSDSDLIGDCLNGSQDSFGLLVDRYQKPIFNLCYRMTGSPEDAGDLAQEAFLKAYQNLGAYKPSQKFFTWLYTIALNLCRNLLKRRKIVRFLSFQVGSEENKRAFDPPSLEPSPGDHLESQEKERIMKELLNLLPARQKALMLLKFNDHLPDYEICKIMDITENNLRVQVHQAKNKLFEEYQKRTARP